MTKPRAVSNAFLAIWITLGIAILSSVVGRLSAQISSGVFYANIFLYGLYAIVPYKINLGRNWARYFFAIMTVLVVAMLLAGEWKGLSTPDLIVSLALLPVDAWIWYSLFKPEADEWFEETEKARSNGHSSI
jgi:uncharacterized membrane protein